MNVAYLGLPGSYSYVAAENYFCTLKPNLIGYETFNDIFATITAHQVDIGVVPLENSLTGSIYQTYDLLLKSNLHITGEVIIKIRHCLLIKKEMLHVTNILEKLNTCYSHIEALKQCEEFFIKHKNIKLIYSNDTASGAKALLDEKNKYASAIANRNTASLYNLAVIKEKIQDNPENYTRFVILSPKRQEEGEKVSVIFTVEHKPGSLLHTLEPYAQMGLNLTKIESRPMVGKPWEYIFFVDFELPGHTGGISHLGGGRRTPPRWRNQEILSSVLRQMKKHVKLLKIIGRYDKGKVYES